jgi:hypothetical protein
MKRGISIMAMSFFLLSIIGSAQSQQPMPAATRAAKLTEWMKTNLLLNDSQLPQVEAINLKYAVKADELRDNTTLGKSEKVEVLRADDRARDEEFKKILTSEQYKTYQSKKSEVKKMLKKKAKEKKRGTR